jgi:hypothetical protein
VEAMAGAIRAYHEEASEGLRMEYGALMIESRVLAECAREIRVSHDGLKAENAELRNVISSQRRDSDLAHQQGHCGAISGRCVRVGDMVVDGEEIALSRRHGSRRQNARRRQSVSALNDRTADQQ